MPFLLSVTETRSESGPEPLRLYLRRRRKSSVANLAPKAFARQRLPPVVVEAMSLSYYGASFCRRLGRGKFAEGLSKTVMEQGEGKASFFQLSS